MSRIRENFNGVENKIRGEFKKNIEKIGCKFKHRVRDEFIIKREEVLPFLHSLEEATGGRGTFRHIILNSRTIRSEKWELKFLNLYLSPLNNGFIVCDRNSRAIRWRLIIPQIIQEELHWQNTKQ